MTDPNRYPYGDAIWPARMKRGYVAEMESDTVLRITCDDSGALIRYALDRREIVEKRGEFKAVAVEMAFATIANALAQHHGTEAPDWRRGKERGETHIFRYDASKRGSEYNSRRAAGLFDEPKEKPADGTAGR